MLVLVASMLVLGIAALCLALRGSRVNDHPHCRGCGFDLAGLAPDQGVLRLMRCPECGRELSRPRAIRVGARQRRALLIALPAIAIAGVLCVAGAYTWGRAAKFNWNSVKPVWMLLHEAHNGNPGAEPEAVQELARRAATGDLSLDNLGRASALALEIHASPTRPWLTAYGDLIERAWQRDLLSEPQKLAYAQDLASIAFSVRPRIRADARAPLRFRFNTGKPSSRGVLSLEVNVALASVSIDGVVCDLSTQPSISGAWTPVGAFAGGSIINDLTLSAPPGPRTLEATLRVRIYPGGQPGTMFGGRPDPPGAPLFEWTETRQTPVEFLAPGIDDIEWITDESLRRRVEAAITVTDVRLSPPSSPDAPLSPIAQATLNVDKCPVALSFDVFWRSGSREWKVGEIADGFPPSRVKRGYGIGWPIDGFDADVVDFVLRPDVDSARTSIDVFKFWGREIVIPNVRVTRFDRAQPAEPAPGAPPPP